MQAEPLSVLPCFCWDSEQDFTWGAGLREHERKAGKYACSSCGNEQPAKPKPTLKLATLKEINAIR